MRTNTKNAYAEVLTIINLLDNDYKDKIPNKLVDFLKKEKNIDHIVEINPNIPLESQNLLEETIDMLAMMKLLYWCSNDGEKQELLNLLNENEEKYQKLLQVKYDPDKLFKNRYKEELEQKREETSIVEYRKNNFIILILNKIRKLFRKDD